MKEPTYTNALRDSWRLTWNHKSLWPYGLFALLLGQMGITELLIKVGMASRTGEIGGMWKYIAFALNPMNWIELYNATDKRADTIMWFIWMIVVLGALAIGVLFVSVVCQGAIIHAAAQYTKLKKGMPDEAKAWHVSVKHFWKLLGLTALRKLVLFLSALVVAWAAVYAATWGGGANWVFLGTLAVTVFVGVVLSIVFMYAAGYVLEEEYGFWESIKAAFRLFHDHWFVSFEVGIILLFMNLAMLILLFVGLIYLFFLPILIGANVEPMSEGMQLIRTSAGIGYVLFGLYAVALFSIFTVYINTCWTYLFMKMHKHGLYSRIKHYFGARKK